MENGNNNRIKYILISLVAALLITAILLTAVIVDRNNANSGDEVNLDKVIEYAGTEYVLKDRVETFLVLGLDKYEENMISDSYNNNQQSDFLMLVILDNKAKKYSTVHINRDTMIEMDILGVSGNKIGTVNKQIALAHTYGSGGIESNKNTAKAVSKLFGDVKINYTMSLTLDSIAIMNNLVGGVTLEVVEDFLDAPGGERLIKGQTVTLTDEETGEEKDFELLARAELDGKLYFALVPADDEDAEEYVILSVEEDGDDLVLSSIEDDDEFDKVEDYFNDLFFSEVDYDE